MGEGTGLDDAANAFEALLNRPGPDADKPSDAKARDADDQEEAETDTPGDEGEDEAQEADEPSEETPEDEEGDEPDEDSDDGEEADDEEEGKSSEPLEPDDKTTVRVKIDGKDQVLDLRTVVNGFQFQSVTTQKAQALAEERRSFDSERTEARRERGEYAQLIHALRGHLDDIGKANQEPDWVKLRAENPTEYLVQRDAWREHSEMRALAQREADRIKAEEAQEGESHLRRYADHQKVLALEAMPAWKDAKVWSKDREAMIETGRKVGLSDQELDRASVDHRVLLLLHKAAAHDRQQAERAKPVRPKADPASPPVARPASKGQAPRPISEATRSRMRLAQTGRVEDAAIAFDQMFGGGSKKRG